MKIPYHDMLTKFPFKDDEMSLRNMEHAELISVGTQDGEYDSSVRVLTIDFPKDVLLRYDQENPFLDGCLSD